MDGVRSTLAGDDAQYGRPGYAVPGHDCGSCGDRAFYWFGALGQDRPVDDAITELSIYIGGSQFLGLPFLIFLYMRGQFSLVPYAFAAICAMHFVLYSWLYQRPLYLAMSLAIAIGGTVIMLARDGDADSSRPASLVCFFTGGAMLLTTAAFLVS